jgi:hypothetical protein
MLLLVFGAGASYGSAAGQSIRKPPLAAQLTEYPDIAAKHPASRAVIDYLDRTVMDGTTSLEEGLASFAALAEHSSDRMTQLTAFRFYLCEVIQDATRMWLSATHGRTYYLSLFNYLLEWQERSKEPIRIVTFNYDTLIENALRSLFIDWRFNDAASYVSRGDWTLMKLHGSITWSRAIASDIAEGRINEERAMAAANLLASPGREFVIENALNPSQYTEQILFPALAVPMAHKTSFECPQLHIEALESCIPDTTRVLLCGWRAAEDHMVQLLQKIGPRCRLGIVSGDDQGLEEVEDRLGDWGRYARQALMEPNGMEALASDLPGKLLGVLGKD